VQIDAEGPIGSVLFARLHNIAERLKTFEVIAIRSSSKTVRMASKFERQRDEMMWNLGMWMTDGAIPADDRLETELHASRWSALADDRMKATSKSELRDILNRSPDRADALCLAVQPPPGWLAEEAEAQARPTATATPERTFDAYRGAEVFEQGGALDPYAAGDAFFGPQGDT
jgi:hypothetical protein